MSRKTRVYNTLANTAARVGIKQDPNEVSQPVMTGSQFVRLFDGANWAMGSAIVLAISIVLPTVFGFESSVLV